MMLPPGPPGTTVPATATWGGKPHPLKRARAMAVNSKGVPFYVEFGANKVASINPQTMVIREWTLPNADSRPRRVAIDAKDMIWYSDYARGYLGRLDPATGKVSEWPSPGGRQAQPYGIAVIGGTVWYSAIAHLTSTWAHCARCGGALHIAKSCTAVWERLKGMTHHGTIAITLGCWSRTTSP